jgi:GNAT superfamily N-acetyltransferase
VRAKELGVSDGQLVLDFCRRRPLVSVFMASRVEAGMLRPGAPGKIYGYPAKHSNAFLHVGTNLTPLAENEECVDAFVEVAKNRVSQSIVGESWITLAYWRALCDAYGREYAYVREVRPSQPLLALSGDPQVPPSPAVKALDFSCYPEYLDTSIRMYTEEVGQQPPDTYPSYCRWTLNTGRAYGVVKDKQVLFKTDVGAAAQGVAQIQGVWLNPRYRGNGLAAGLISAVVTEVRKTHPTVTLYVNSFNTRALRAYKAVGFSQVGEFATILY